MRRKRHWGDFFFFGSLLQILETLFGVITFVVILFFFFFKNNDRCLPLPLNIDFANGMESLGGCFVSFLPPPLLRRPLYTHCFS